VKKYKDHSRNRWIVSNFYRHVENIHIYEKGKSSRNSRMKQKTRENTKQASLSSFFKHQIPSYSARASISTEISSPVPEPVPSEVSAACSSNQGTSEDCVIVPNADEDFDNIEEEDLTLKEWKDKNLARKSKSKTRVVETSMEIEAETDTLSNFR